MYVELGLRDTRDHSSLHSNFGGYFGPMLKFAGYDGIIIEGKADNPVWVDIRDENVQIKDAGRLWGLGFFETEEKIWSEIAGKKLYGEWLEGTTQRAAILGIGQCGENLGRIGCLVHEVDDSAGCGGFGGVFGSKHLKAISVIGTGSIEVTYPKKLLEEWKWVAKYKVGKQSVSFPPPLSDARPIGCFACTAACKVNNTEKEMAGSTGQCIEERFYLSQDTARHEKATRAKRIAGQLTQDYTINAYAAFNILIWLESLHKRGLLGKGKRIDTDLDFDKLGTEEFAREYLRKIAYREGIGDTLAEGWVRAAAKWGVLEEDLKTGEISAIHWGIGDQHWTNNIEWAYLSLFGARDCNAHDMKYGSTLEETVERYTKLVSPWHDPLMLDQSEVGVYSIHMARLVAWHSRYANIRGSLPGCDWFHPDVFNEHTEDGKGLSPEMEERFYANVTGENLSWEEGLEIGRKTWNLNRAILVLHGRHRNEEYFPPYPPYTCYVYTEGLPTLQSGSYTWRGDIEREGRKSLDFRPLEAMQYGVYEDGKWRYSTEFFSLDKDKTDEFKTIYYDLEGWDTETGWPTKSTLEDCGLGYVANVLEKQGKQLKS